MIEFRLTRHGIDRLIERTDFEKGDDIQEYLNKVWDSKTFSAKGYFKLLHSDELKNVKNKEFRYYNKCHFIFNVHSMLRNKITFITVLP